jgi:3-deoxy-7-phosphoheptulonate synthase
MVLIDFYPVPTAALCDGPQALSLAELPRLVRYIDVVRQAFEVATTPG